MALRPIKKLGQNYLSDPNTARKIVNALRAPAEAAVVEIGPGQGALTGLMLKRWPRVTALEVDTRAVELLGENYPTLDVRLCDVLAVDWTALSAELGRPLYVIGNLPYYITSEILFRLIDAGPCVREVVVMMQLEVAQRLVAVPRTKAYGILSVVVQHHAQPELLFRVSRNVFFPKPDVTSALIRLAIKPATDIPSDLDPAFFRSVVRTAFNQRRKTLRNSLSRWTIEAGIPLPNDWEKCRAEELTPEAFVELAQYLRAHIKPDKAVA